jgi:colanic acid/amylovoran biosynthesis glycosyltransferase
MRQMTIPSANPKTSQRTNQGTVVVFRTLLLPPSETFIAAQAVAMRRFSPFFVGWRKTTGINLPENTSWTVDDGGLRGRLRELRFRYAGPTRKQVARLRARAPRLVYAHFAPDGYAAMQLAEQLGVPLVTALHGYDVTISDEAMSRTRLGRAYLQGRSTLQKTGALFLSCSDYVRARGLEMGYPADRTIVHSIGVDLERFKPPGILRPREKSVLFVGRLVVRCRFLGVQPTAVVRDRMSRASVFCVPSVVAASGDAEGFGMVFIEAQAMGLPVVSTLSGGIPEAVKNGETGLLVAERDSAALAEAILRLMQDKELWQQYSLAGRRNVVNHFNLVQQTGRLENLFEQLLADPYQAGAGAQWGN